MKTAIWIHPSAKCVRAPCLKSTNYTLNERHTEMSLEALKEACANFPHKPPHRKPICHLKNTVNSYSTHVSFLKMIQKQPGSSLAKEQQRIKEYLDKVSTIQYKADHTDISFSVEGRTWINSDGKTNMPSGEVFSAPVEDSVNGKVHFTFPSVYMGKDVSGITLWVENGVIKEWKADQGHELLDEVFSIEGANQFGEVAIGTNYKIQRSTRNILFDEKIGGTIHMAVGQSYKQCGGLNTSSIHWDMITDMQESGQIYADGTLIYEKGKFLI